MKTSDEIVRPKARNLTLTKTRNLKMSRSSHAYVRGSTVKFYEWLEEQKKGSLPDGPPVWICGDCHVGNLGPVANSTGRIGVQIRDLDQTVIGNPAHDLIRLGLSLASAARGSDLPGVTTAKMLEQMMEGYEKSFEPDFQEESDIPLPEAIRVVTKKAAAASWKTLAEERIKDAEPTIPIGRRFWPMTKPEAHEIKKLFEDDEMRKLATMLRSRKDDARVKLMDAAYWMKGCSSLGRLRFAVVLRVGDKKEEYDYCIMDIKEAAQAAAPRSSGVKMPSDQAERVVEGARNLSPYLGKRMRAVKLMDKAVVRPRTPAAGPQDRSRTSEPGRSHEGCALFVRHCRQGAQPADGFADEEAVAVGTATQPVHGPRCADLALEKHRRPARRPRARLPRTLPEIRAGG